MKATIFTIGGEKKSDVELPNVFNEPVREDLIARAVIAEQTLKRQPKGAYKKAGLQTSAEYRGRKEAYGSIKNKGISRLPREKLPKGRFGRVRIVPFSKGGRRAHPPNPEKILVEKINAQERKKAIASAISASAKRELVEKRGHFLNGAKAYPIVIENAFESISRTRDVVSLLDKLGFASDLQRAENSSKRRSGVMGNRRGGVRKAKSVLIVVGEDRGLGRGARNILGVDVSTVDKLSASLLAPGTRVGRLTVWSEGALEKLKNW